MSHIVIGFKDSLFVNSPLAPFRVIFGKWTGNTATISVCVPHIITLCSSLTPGIVTSGNLRFGSTYITCGPFYRQAQIHILMLTQIIGIIIID